MAKKIRTIKKYQNKKVRVDPLYQSFWFSKFINKFMLQGKKHLIEKIMYNSFYQMKNKFRRQPLILLFIILMKLKPLLGFISKRLGKEWKQIPVPLAPRRQLIMALKWLVAHTKTESDRTLEARLIRVFNSFFQKKKTALTKYRNQYHFNLTQERVNSRFRWK